MKKKTNIYFDLITAKKYIDAEKLKEILLPSYEEAKKESLSVTDVVKWEKVEYIFDFVFHLIDSLQQEQESVAERFARIIRGNLTGIDKEVQQKFEQLYFEVTGNKMYGGYND